MFVIAETRCYLKYRCVFKLKPTAIIATDAIKNYKIKRLVSSAQPVHLSVGLTLANNGTVVVLNQFFSY